MSISSNIRHLKSELPSNVELVAVSKFHEVEAIKEAYDAGQRFFGESKMQELVQKSPMLPNDIQWHFIGHLQTNKVKAIIPFVDTIHSVDSWKLFSEIEKQASIVGKRVRCLLEIHIAEEDAKLGLSFDMCRDFLNNSGWKDCKFAYIGGVMGMATYTEDEDRIRKEFKSLKSFFDEIKEEYFSDFSDFSEISMGMSGDYKIAIEEGATLVRVGSSIFGNRG